MSAVACPDPRRYPSSLAARALRRAARLQVEAAEHAERSAPVAALCSSTRDYERGELVEASAAAGIDPHYLRTALVELEDERASFPARRELSDDPSPTSWLATDRGLLVSRTIPGTPAEVWTAIGRVFEARDIGFQLQRLSETHPTEGGAAHYRMMTFERMLEQRRGVSPLCYGMGQIGLSQVVLRLHDRGEHTLVTLCGDLLSGTGDFVDRSRRGAAVMSVFFGLMAASVGGAAAGLLGALGLGFLGVVGGLGLSQRSSRSRHRKTIDTIEQSLGALLDDVAARRRSEVAYRPQREAIAQRVASSSWATSH